jgi:hypothetical protein
MFKRKICSDLTNVQILKNLKFQKCLNLRIVHLYQYKKGEKGAEPMHHSRTALRPTLMITTVFSGKTVSVLRTRETPRSGLQGNCPTECLNQSTLRKVLRTSTGIVTAVAASPHPAHLCHLIYPMYVVRLSLPWSPSTAASCYARCFAPLP